MAGRSFILWLHGLGDSGPANEPIKNLFTSHEFRNTKWSFPSAPHAPVTCNCALTLASVLLYPKTLGGGAVFSGWVPFNSSITEQITPEAKQTPILWSHGLVDKTVLFEAGQAAPPFLQKIGVGCEFKAYPGLAHSINNEELRYLESWIKARLQSSS
ncbi:hypothetical protein TSUD_203270 [Trifolium subterraneum]|uniref:Phospholipase/carboxylesterase/thioesterase domain-containing protein n=1 Tax=Trifolium subterraneum TaxID=3900 RepID=A0A2Z6LLN2_TRISU|nr:hypothetical protein TSUD_203270 [Trifolium subterraneum]